MSRAGTVLALSGGIGGAKLALGLSRIVSGDQLVVVANTGDDFEHLGLYISPDLDTLMYTLAGIENPETGWGRATESWSFMDALADLGGETWFRLGDKDLAVHVERTRRLKAGETVSQIADGLRRRLAVATRLLPMSDDEVRTRVRTDQGWLDFQDYFVRLRCAPRVIEIAFEGAAQAKPHPEFMRLLADRTLRAVVICPSNPFISIEPILALPGVRGALRDCIAPVVAVSPIIGGKAVKGPTAKMMDELGLETSSAAIARRYAGLIDGFVADNVDAETTHGLDARVVFAQTLMRSFKDRVALARFTLDFAQALDDRRVAG